jgi:transposase
MTTWIATQRHWLVVERLPGYAHDINPIEMVWGNVKQVELANLCPDTIDEAQAAAEAGLDRAGQVVPDQGELLAGEVGVQVCMRNSISESVL